MNLAPLMSSEHMGWETPQWLLKYVRSTFNGPIGLDPATTDANPTEAQFTYTPALNGLDLSWCEMGLVWVNPPYGRELIHWAGKMAIEAEAGAEIVALIPARTDTAWWQEYITRANAICFIRGRLRFEGAPHSAPFPSAVAYWGPRGEAFKNSFADLGWVVTP